MEEDTAVGLKDAIRVDQGQLRGHIDEVVRSSVEETLNGLLDAEADRICRAQRYEHSPERVDTRADRAFARRTRKSLDTTDYAVLLLLAHLGLRANEIDAQ